MNEQLRRVIENSRRIAFLGGAGLSTESGIPDFRSADGLYKAQTAYGHSVITQNIDGLHQDAGSRNVLELHGSVHRNYCTKCRKFYPMEYILESEGVPTCACGGVIKPDVVLYGEGLETKTLISAVTHIQRADTLIVGGTSLAVYPAAGLIDYFSGRELVLINLSRTDRDSDATLCVHEKIGEALSFLLEGE